MNNLVLFIVLPLAGVVRKKKFCSTQKMNSFGNETNRSGKTASAARKCSATRRA